MAALTLSGMRKSFGTTEVVHGIDLQVENGEFCVLVGPSGCGKSTLLRMIAGLEEITHGTLSIGNRVVNNVAPKERDIAMVFQNYALYPHMTVFDNMAFSLKLAGESADATRKRGFEYYGVADHSQSAHYAGGLSLEEIAAQHREADRLNKRYGDKFRILKGIEADILADGSLDYPDHILEDFDFVVASVHSRFKLPKKGADRASSQGDQKSAYHNHRAYDRPSAAAASRI